MSIGIGAMLGYLGGNRESAEAFAAAVGKRITSVVLDEEAGDGGALQLRFEDGTGIQLEDAGRSCCESRYMRTDDDLSAHIGATLIGAEVLDGRFQHAR